ncbi:cora-domain-containing protein [Piedraia hortae CBS 480.64]|uniref:Cora-domain-containing protein n=1 Tax=Piedraia hortae CBS 480.64 TaxID=1314780 RepID=A0A6A7C2T4_9PEZI|nr:cora-domain-containing protein [Piedraia hortae CBS 480.64]
MSYSAQHKSERRYAADHDLDDHRNQPESLPLPAEGQGQRRGTLASLASNERPRLYSLEPPREVHGSIAQELESAIVDDGKSACSGRSSRRSPTSRRATDDAPVAMRRESSPIVARRGTFRRQAQARNNESYQNSRPSSRNSGSTTPNSVAAFAPPLSRPRADTIESRAVASASNVSLNHTLSNGGRFSRRRMTAESSAHGGRTDSTSVRSSVEEDVCFPPEGPTSTYTIDFDDLEEFVAESHSKTPVAHPFAPRFTQHNEGHYANHDNEPQRSSADQLYRDSSESKAELDAEKCENKVANGTPNPTDPIPLNRLPSYTDRQNRFTFFSSEIEETIHSPELGGLLLPGERFRDLFELGPEGGVWWLDMLNPSEEEIFAICGAFRVHPLTREDITTQETREKIEMFKSYYFLCFQSFNALDSNSEDYLEPINVYAVVFREGLLTFTFCQTAHAANVRKRIGRLRDYINISADWICYALIDTIVDSFAPVLRDVEKETDTIEDNVFTFRTEDGPAILHQINDCRKRVVSLIRLLGGKADVIKSFAKKCNEAHEAAPRDVDLYLSDVQDHIVTMTSNLGHFETILARCHQNHLSQSTMLRTEQGMQQNALLSRLTVFATVMVPMNLIAGMFGMNVNVPGKDADGYGWFFGILGTMCTIAIVCVALAKKLQYV